MCRRRRCSQLHEAPVKRIPLVAGLHCIVAVPRSRVNASNMHPDDISPRRRLFWVTTTTFFFNFPDFSGARSITSSRSNSAPARVDSRRTLLFSALLRVCRSRAISCSPENPDSHQSFFGPLFAENFQPGTFDIRNRRPSDTQDSIFVWAIQYFQTGRS